jgi:photosystem II stability/assembly factor-like uncharacterized protein
MTLDIDNPAAKTDGSRQTLLMVATRKGAWFYYGDSARQTWRTDGPHFLGHIINHLLLDPRDGRTLLAAAKTGHLGPTIFRSTDFGQTWQEAAKPPAFATVADGSGGRAVDHTFWLTPGHADEPDVWYAGTSPQGLFRSEDGGVNWAPFPASTTTRNTAAGWAACRTARRMDRSCIRSSSIRAMPPISIWPMSGGGVHESADGGRTFAPLIDGLEVVEGFEPSDAMFHDPHCVRLCPSNPDRLYQQNHCGIYRLDRPADQWQRIGRSMPAAVGDIGFPMVVHPRDADVAWVFPMDGTTVWPRTSPDGKPAVYGTRDGGETWQRLDAGLPGSQAWWTVKRQAMTADSRDPVGLYFGTTSGELWMSRDEGRQWECIATHLPEIYAVEAAELA